MLGTAVNIDAFPCRRLHFCRPRMDFGVLLKFPIGNFSQYAVKAYFEALISPSQKSSPWTKTVPSKVEPAVSVASPASSLIV
jgi:hypothetical protein